MAPTRRRILQGAAFGLAVLPPPLRLRRPRSRSGGPFHILILGGTGFLGPHIVRAALARGHRVTLFNRGRTNPQLFPELEKLVGDRDPEQGEGLSALEGRSFDAVVDTSGYYPRHVRASAGLLAPRVGHYLFVSSISVYPSFEKKGITEDEPIPLWEGEVVERFRNETYGPYKYLCEQAASEAMEGRCTHVRPGLIVGPGDPTPRFSYWPLRVRRGGEILAPGRPTDPVQYIDARDLAAWMVSALEQRLQGTYNLVGPDAPATLADLLHGCKAVTGGDASFTWVDAGFLAGHELRAWAHLPVWADPEGAMGGLNQVSNARARATGFRSRPLAETVAGVLDWYDTLPQERQGRLRFPLKPEREAEVLSAWRVARRGSAGGE